MVIDNNPDIPAGGDKVYTIIVAAGSGLRFGSAVPKQFLPLAGVPVLVRTVRAISDALPAGRILLVLSPDGEKYWHDISAGLELPDVTIVHGGASRSESVANAITYIESRGDATADTIVMVHDGARPLVHPDMVRTLHAAFGNPDILAAVPVLPLTEAIATVSGEDVVPTPRDGFRTVQTPQAFRGNIIAEAYRAAEGAVYADDAAVVAAYTGKSLHSVRGHVQNIKITNATDIAIAEVLLAHPLPY